MIEASYISAFIGGLLTFLAPCTLPLIPAYLAFISGSGNTKKSNNFSRFLLFKNALAFVIGFSVVFIFFGIISGALSKFLYVYRPLLSQIGGAIIILLGLSMLRVFEFNIFKLFPKLPPLKLPKFIIPGSTLGAFLLGFMFAIGWSPCLGPVLGTILLIAGTSGTALNGGLLLSVYSLGLALPFLIVAYLYGQTFTYVTALQKFLPTINIIGALMIITIGFFLLIGQFGTLNSWSAQLLGDFTTGKFMQYM